MKLIYRFLLVISLLFCTSIANAQQLSREQIGELLEKNGCVALGAKKVNVCKYDFTSDGLRIEAITFRPPGEGRFPSLMLIPGYQQTVLSFLKLGVLFADEGFASIAITQPGWGGSQGKPDYVGPNTLKVLTQGFKKFKREPYVDSKRMGLYGHSRGGMAAALLSTQLDGLEAAILAAGIYDFKKNYEEVKLSGIKRNMELETGMTDKAIRERSAILRMDELKCPLLILHGVKDENVPVSQAFYLRDRLTELKKEFEIKIFPDLDHFLNSTEVSATMIDFLSRKLQGDLPKQ